MIAEGKHLEPRQAIVQIKTGLQSTLRNMQGDEDQQNECSRILTDMAGERIALEQGMLLPMESPQGRSEFGIWEHRRGYGYSPQDAPLSAYNQLGFDEHAATRLETADARFQTSGLFSDEFDMDHLSKIMYD